MSTRTSSPEDGPSEPSAAAAAHEPLACVSCRSRKLKCDRKKPICTRCSKARGECAYPESRRKPAFKRKNVRELEERLAQVEGLLKTVGKQRASQPAHSDGAPTADSSPVVPGGQSSRPERLRGSPRDEPMPWIPLSPTGTPSSRDTPRSGELLGLGQFESLPPFEMMEDLYGIFFETQHHFLPLIHPASYLRSFHSPAHMRPPMCLQYAIWTVAAHGHPKYGSYYDALYRRARQYLEADELKGHGEHFITIGHAQAWALVATEEARCLMFTRASMSSARSIRLTGMMGLHRLDNTLAEEELPMAPMIAPPRSWVELEERRRLFWGGFCIDSYANISAGWPTLIDVHQITTHLPVSEDAFMSSREEKSTTLKDALRGASYSKLGGTAVICHIFSQLMNHAHRPLPDDRPEDPEFGPFWKRHRELDNMLSSAFMFLPERLRLPRNMHDSVAVQANLNLHGATICLHIAAREKADKFKLAGIGQASRTRALTAAQEIIDIIKVTHMKGGYKGPLLALSLYFAASVYITQAKENPEEFDKTNLELPLQRMNAIGHQHIITHAYLNQLLADIERHGISVSVDNLPDLNHANVEGCSHGISLVARGLSSRHTKVPPPIPGRFPLGAPQGAIPFPLGLSSTFLGPESGLDPGFDNDDADSDGPASKRMRTSARSNTGAARMPSAAAWGVGRATAQTVMDPAPDLFEYTGGGWSYSTKFTTASTTTTATINTTLPHRTGSPAVNHNNRAASAATTTTNFPDFATFPMPGSMARNATAPIFPPMPVAAAAPGLGDATSFRLNPTSNTNTNTNTSANTRNSEELGSLDMFDSLGEWGVNDSESFYAMLLDVSNSIDASQNDDNNNNNNNSLNMDPWAQLHNAGAGGSGSAGGGGGGAWDTTG
ncbi:transcriptional activator protein acu-15 [Chaetomidium leptoderma]|uniref:Transcriptional activator protein acu-15 n=1 Tax=Chaetomidium leptoderma TaxID=669021 RepID=A0AAN6VE67_9PEZI|nr:transcriptional activator protein acu-15 [Chaetomidium leptoderma]